MPLRDEKYMMCPQCAQEGLHVLLVSLPIKQGSHEYDTGPKRPKERMRQRLDHLFICPRCSYEVDDIGREPI